MKNYVDFTVNNHEYKLALSTRALCDMETKLGRNPIDILLDCAQNKMPCVKDMVIILHAALVKYNHGITFEECYDLFDSWIDENHTYIDFIAVMVEIFQVSGIIEKGNEEASNPSLSL